MGDFVSVEKVDLAAVPWEGLLGLEMGVVEEVRLGHGAVAAR